jgi:ABC-2 type transport system ATP-binding protein
MKTTLTNAGKRFNRDWIFRHLSYQFISGHSYAITGPNGSGKSTLLQVIAGAMAVNEGKIAYEMTVDSGQLTENVQPSTVNRQLSTESIYQHIAFCAPSLELIEEMTLQEFLAFHRVFKPFFAGMTIPEILDAVQLSQSAHKQIREFSSGMKQRVKLAQSILLDTPLLLLDEPCTNLDLDGIAMYHQLIRDYTANRTVIVSSNDVQEYLFCKEKIDITDFK